MFCSRCGASIDRSHRFCPACGAAIEWGDTEPTIIAQSPPAPGTNAPQAPHVRPAVMTAAQPPRRRTPLAPIIAGLVVLAVIAAAGAAFALPAIGRLLPPIFPAGSSKTTDAASTPLTMLITQIDNSAFPEVTVYSRITDHSGAVVEGLDASAFTIVETDAQGTVHDAVVSDVRRLATGDLLNLNLVLDQSGSMNQSGKMAGALRAANTFLAGIQTIGTNNVEITSFDSYVYTRQPFTGDHAALRAALSTLSPQGETALFDAIASALKQTSLQSGAKCVIVFTDGRENASSYTQADVVQLARLTNIPVYIIGIGTAIDEPALRGLAGDTNGLYFNALETDLGAALARIYDDIYAYQRDSYEIRYTSGFTEAKDAFRTVRVSAADGSAYAGQAERAYQPVVDLNTEFGPAYATLDYINPYSSQRLLTSAELNGLSLAELRIARNEIFARHGRQFEDPLLNKWFYSKQWYLALPQKHSPDDFDAHHNNLSKTERDNVTAIVAAEERLRSGVIFPDALRTRLTLFDVSLSKPVLSRGLAELYQSAGVPQGALTTLPPVARANAELIQLAIDNPQVDY